MSRQRELALDRGLFWSLRPEPSGLVRLVWLRSTSSSLC